MRRLAIFVAGLVILAGAAWSGVWFVLSQRIPDEIAKWEADVTAQGGIAAHEALRVSGFPLAHVTRIEGLHYRAPPGDEPLEIRIPWAEARAEVLSPLEAEARMAEAVAVRTVIDGIPVSGTLETRGLVVRAALRNAAPEARFSAGTAAFIAEPAGGPGLSASGLRGVVTPDRRGQVEAARLALDWPDRDMRIALNALDLSGNANDTRATLNARAAKISGHVPGAGLDAAETTVELDLPLRRGTAPQSLGAALTMAEPRPDADLWALLDPTGRFPRSLGPLSARAQVDAIIRKDIEDWRGAGDIALRTITLEDLSIAAAGVDLNARGHADHVETGADGSVIVTASGWREAMNAAMARGLIPPTAGLMIGALIAGASETDAETGASRLTLTLRGGEVFMGRMRIFQLPKL